MPPPAAAGPLAAGSVFFAADAVGATAAGAVLTSAAQTAALGTVVGAGAGAVGGGLSNLVAFDLGLPIKIGAKDIIGGVFSLGSSLIQGQGAVQQAGNEAAVLRARANEAANDAVRKKQIAALNARDSRKRSELALGTVAATLGGSGVQGGTGSPALNQLALVEQAAITEAQITQDGLVAASAAERQAQLFRDRAQASLDVGNFRAGALLVSGITRAFV